MDTPSSHDIEKAVLACALNDSGALAIVCGKLNEDDFYNERNRLIFRTIAAMFTSDAPVDLLTVGDEMDLKELSNRIGGRSYLADIATSFITSTNIGHYIDRLKDVALRRRLHLESNHLLRIANDTTISADEALSAAQNRLISLHDGRCAQENEQTISDIANGWMDPQKRIWFKSGMEQWDKHMYGWKPGMWYVLAADQNVGKSAWAQNAFLRAIHHNEHLAGIYFTFDDDVSPALARVVACLCQGSLTIKNVEELHAQSEELRFKAISRLDMLRNWTNNGRFTIRGNTHSDISSITAEVKRVKRDTGKQVMVVIDSLSHVSVNGKRDSTSNEGVSKTSEAIHRLTKLEEVIMLTVSQINKRPGHWDREKGTFVSRLPNIDDIPYGKQIAFDAAWVGLLTQDQKEPYKMVDYKRWYHNRIYVDKNKTGPYKDNSIHYVMDGECCLVREC